MTRENIPLRGQLAYASGMLGWSTLTSAVAVMLVYFYQPPSESGLVNLIPKIGVLGVVNAMSLIMITARLWDAVIDPVIAWFSDKSQHRLGRRIWFMRISLLPILVTCFFLFTPATRMESQANIWYLVFIQILFNLSVSLYIIPYNAMLPELGHSSILKLRLATYQQLGFIIGWILAASCPALVDYFKSNGMEPFRAYQYAIWIVFSIGCLFLVFPAFFVNEKRYCDGVPTSDSLFGNLLPVLKNRNFFLYLVSDFTYFISLTTMGTGALYYVTVLLHLPERYGTIMIIIMVSLSVLFYPLVNWLGARVSKKVIVLISLIGLAFIFLYVFYLGNMGMADSTEAILLSVVMAVPLAFLGILPPVILAEITQYDSIRTGQNREATYFAIRSLFIQFGQTLGLALFTILIGLEADKGTGRWLQEVFPNIPFEELGIRLTGIIGFSLCLLAALIFLSFRYNKMAGKLREWEGE
ncbi:MAG: MFS transporter [Chitinophagales bacterium]|nr:MFS transporter [Chitinophagales bacterium]